MYVFNISNSIRLRLEIGLYGNYLPSTSSIACLLISIFSGSSILRLDEKMSVYSFYSLRISDGDFSGYKVASNMTRKGCIVIADSKAFRAAT